MRLFVLFVLLLSTLVMLPAAAAQSTDGTEIVAVVPSQLSAIDDNNARCYESSLGSAVADAVRVSLDCDIAVIGGGDLDYGLLPGETTYDEIRHVFIEDRRIASASVTIKELRTILENGLSHIKLDRSEKIDESLSAFDGFPQISGFMFFCDVSAPPGERIYELRINGEKVELDSETQTVTLGSTDYMLSGGYRLLPVDEVELSDLTLSEVFLQYVNDGLKEYSPTVRRIHMRGYYDSGISEFVPVIVFPILAVVFIVAYLSSSRRRTKSQTETFTC